MAKGGARITDRRTQRTRRLLHEALVSLVQEKAYDAISVKEILDRADVGRSTFYTHFGEKDELLVSVIRDMLRSARPSHSQASAAWYEAFVAFSLPLFERIHGHRDAVHVALGARGWAILHEQLQKVLVDSIAKRMREELPIRRKEATHVPTDILVQYVASTFLLVLNWWMESRNRMSPKEVDAVFRELVLPTLTALCTGGKDVR